MPESAILAQYCLPGIAGDTSLAPTDIDAQQAYDAQLMKVQMATQRKNMVLTSVSNFLKTRHDTVENSIGNIY